MRGTPDSAGSKGRRDWIVVGSIALVIAIPVVATARRLRGEPMGSFHSYSIVAHSPRDLLTFENGSVQWHTCCGDQDWGTYRKDPDGRWIWTCTAGNKRVKPTVWIVEPGVFGMTFSDTQTAPSFTLRRRLFEKIPY